MFMSQCIYRCILSLYTSHSALEVLHHPSTRSLQIDCACAGRYRIYYVKPAAQVAGARGATASSVSMGDSILGDKEEEKLLGSDPGARLRLRGGKMSGLQLGAAAVQLNVSMRWYNASDGADGAIASGAYIFRCDVGLSTSSIGVSPW